MPLKTTRQYTHYTTEPSSRAVVVKPQKARSQEYLTKILLAEECCSLLCIQQQFTPCEVKQYLLTWSDLTTDQVTHRLQDILSAAKQRDGNGKSTIARQSFNLSINNKPVCTQAFKWLTLTSHTKLIKLVANNEDETMQQLIDDHHIAKKETKAARVTGFLHYLSTHCVKEFTFKSGYNMLRGIASKHEAWHLFISTLNEEDPLNQMTKQYFDDIWRAKFPSLICDDNKMECAKCMQYSTRKEDLKLSSQFEQLKLLEAQHKEHLDFAQAERDYDSETDWLATNHP